MGASQNARIGRERAGFAWFDWTGRVGFSMNDKHRVDTLEPESPRAGGPGPGSESFRDWLPH